MNESCKILKRDLKAIGVCPGDFLVVHSSMRSMGYVEGGPECVIHAMLDTLGEEGTLMMPTFTYEPCYTTSFFSHADTPSCVGLLSETFRKMDGVFRTDHPTHSVAIRGKLLPDLIEKEREDDTPMGPHSPYRKLGALGAKILMLGCSLRHTSYLHALEEEADLFYALRGHQEYTVVAADGQRCTRAIRRHNFNRADGALIQRYDRLLEILAEGDYTRGPVHGAEAVLIDAAKLREKALRKMAEEPLFFVDDPDGFYPEDRKQA